MHCVLMWINHLPLLCEIYRGRIKLAAAHHYARGWHARGRKKQLFNNSNNNNDDDKKKVILWNQAVSNLIKTDRKVITQPNPTGLDINDPQFLFFVICFRFSFSSTICVRIG